MWAQIFIQKLAFRAVEQDLWSKFQYFSVSMSCLTTESELKFPIWSLLARSRNWGCFECIFTCVWRCCVLHQNVSSKLSIWSLLARLERCPCTPTCSSLSWACFEIFLISVWEWWVLYQNLNTGGGGSQHRDPSRSLSTLVVAHFFSDAFFNTRGTCTLPWGLCYAWTFNMKLACKAQGVPMHPHRLKLELGLFWNLFISVWEWGVLYQNGNIGQGVLDTESPQGSILGQLWLIYFLMHF
jgi:hypothetical protein